MAQKLLLLRCRQDAILMMLNADAQFPLIWNVRVGEDVWEKLQKFLYGYPAVSYVGVVFFSSPVMSSSVQM